MREVVDSVAAFAVRVLGMLSRGDAHTEPQKLVGATMMMVEASQREYADKEAKVRFACYASDSARQSMAFVSAHIHGCSYMHKARTDTALYP